MIMHTRVGYNIPFSLFLHASPLEISFQTFIAIKLKVRHNFYPFHFSLCTFCLMNCLHATDQMRILKLYTCVAAKVAMSFGRTQISNFMGNLTKRENYSLNWVIAMNRILWLVIERASWRSTKPPKNFITKYSVMQLIMYRLFTKL